MKHLILKAGVCATLALSAGLVLTGCGGGGGSSSPSPKPDPNDAPFVGTYQGTTRATQGEDIGGTSQLTFTVRSNGTVTLLSVDTNGERRTFNGTANFNAKTYTVTLTADGQRSIGNGSFTQSGTSTTANGTYEARNVSNNSLVQGGTITLTKN